MSRSALFWGILLIAAGSLLGLQAAGIIEKLNWGYVFGVALICAGLLVVLGAFRTPKLDENQAVSVLVGSASEAHVNFELGASSLIVSGGASPDHVLEGTSGTALSINATTEGDLVNVSVEAGPSFIPFLGPEGGAWVFKLNSSLPMSIELEGGASSYDLDLTDLKLSRLEIESGASSAKIVCPANAGKTFIKIDGGAASFEVRVPDGVAAQIRVDQGATALSIDETRFPVNRNGYYESADYDNAKNRVEIQANLGAGSLTIK